MNENGIPLKKNHISSNPITIAYVGTKLSAPMQIRLLSAIKKITQEKNITLYQFGGSSSYDPQSVISQSSFIYELINPKKLDGMICWSSQLFNKKGVIFDIEELLKNYPEFPAVFIGKPIEGYPTFLIDNSNAIKDMLNHLIHVHKFKKIAFISGPEFHIYSRERYQAYKEGLKENGIEFDPKLVYTTKSFGHHCGERAVQYFLDEQKLQVKKDFEAIVCISDVFALSAIEELKRRKISIPEDIAVVGFNNKYESLYSNPTITTIDINFEEMGKDSLELLLSMIGGEKKEGIIYKPTTLVLRQSCGCMQGNLKLVKSSEAISQEKHYNSKKELIDKLIIEKKQQETQFLDNMDKLKKLEHKWNLDLYEGLIKSIQKEEAQPFLQEVENILTQIDVHSIYSFHWNFYILKLRNRVVNLIVEEDLKKWVDMLFYNTNLLLIEKTEREKAYNQMKMVYSQSRNMDLYLSIVSTDEFSTLLDLLANKLPDFGIQACYFFEFHDSENSLKQSKLKLAYNTNGVFRLHENEDLVESCELIPQKYDHSLNNLINIILPLYFKRSPMGYLIIAVPEITEFNGIIFELLRNLISTSLQRTKDLEKLKLTQKKLEQKALEQSLSARAAKEAHEQKNQFFINVAHETKTPLTLIQNYLSYYMEQNAPDDNLMVIKQNVDLLLANMLNFLDAEKLQKGMTVYKHDSLVNLSDIVDKKCALFQVVAKKKNIKIVYNLKEDCVIKIDPWALDRILNNILDNAVKYIQEGGLVTIDVDSTDDSVNLTISDNGPGLPSDSMEHIFEAYYLLSRKKTGQQGIGVGLSIVKKIIDEIDASISVSKNGVKGTCFSISFIRVLNTAGVPFAEEIPETQPLPVINRKIKERKISPEKSSILVVDDNLELLEFIQSSLEDDYNIFLAKNTSDAVFKLRTIPHPELIISDVMMDEADGFELLKSLTKIEGYNDIPFIFLTAMRGESAKLEGLRLGAIDFIEKPFSIVELTAKIKSMVKLQERQKKREILRIRSELDNVFSHFYNQIDNPAKPDFLAFCQKFKINDREKEIIKFLINGLIQKEISAKLNISQRAVQYHITKIYRKCNVSNKYDLLEIFR